MYVEYVAQKVRPIVRGARIKWSQLSEMTPKPIESAAKSELNIPPEPAILPFKFRLLPTTRRQKNTPHLQDTNAGSIFLETVIHPKQAILEERQFLVDSLVSAEATVP